MRSLRLVSFTGFLAAATLLVVTSAAGQATFKRGVLTITQGRTRTVLQVEVADTPVSRAQGLMNRKHLADDAGMLFIFEASGRGAFWMKNTKIPLDILYFDADARFVSGQFNVPTCAGGDRCPSYPSDSPAKYVLELNAGVGKRRVVVQR